MISSLSIVIPAYDEAPTLRETLPRIVDGIPPSITEVEVLVVDDGSSDGTADVVRDVAARHPFVTCIAHERNGGMGRALRTGFAHARHEWVLYLDADHQARIDELAPIASRSTIADAVIGYRPWHRDGVVRTLIAITYRVVTRLLLGVTARDVNCPFKLVRRDVIQSLPLASNGFLIDAEILHMLQRRGVAVEEVPVARHPRRFGASSIRFRHLPELVRELVQLRRAGAWSGRSAQ